MAIPAELGLIGEVEGKRAHARRPEAHRDDPGDAGRYGLARRRRREDRGRGRVNLKTHKELSAEMDRLDLQPATGRALI